MTLITDLIAQTDVNYKPHVAGAFSTSVLRRLEELLPASIKHSAETGCGKSTILFSNVSDHHTVFCLDDRVHGENSSVTYFQSCSLTKNERVHMVFGPTQKTLPVFQDFKPYDVVLIDGPHGYPFPEIEYYYFYPHMRAGGILIVDDVHIASIGRLADFIGEDEMFEPVELVSTTAVFRRTEAPAFDPLGDGWWTQQYNRRRIPRHMPYLAEYVLDDKNERPAYASHFETTPTKAAGGFLKSQVSKILNNGE